MKEAAFLTSSFRSVNPNQIIVERIFSQPLTENGEKNHCTGIVLGYTNCFRSAALVEKLTQKIEDTKEGIMYVEPCSIHYGFNENFSKVDFAPDDFNEKALHFIMDGWKSYPTVIVNLMDTGVHTYKYAPNFLNILTSVHRTHRADIFLLFTKSRLKQYIAPYERILKNTDSLIFVEDFIDQ